MGWPPPKAPPPAEPAPPARAGVSDEALRALPKSELHVHLDGSLRPATLADLARERGVSLPTLDPNDLGAYMRVSDARNLEEYLQRFALTVSVLQDAESLERVSRELAEDNVREQVRYLEVRFCPALHTEGAMSADQVLEAVLRGLEEAEAALPIRTGVIVCALRTLSPGVSLEMAELALAYRERGVCGFDLAGAEKGFPVKAHVEAFRRVQRADLPVTIHAGEGYGAPSVRQALEDGRADRLGHGTRLGEDPELMARVRDRGIPLEVCLTSNVQTRVVRSYGTHPLRRYLDAGLALTLCTDNRLMSGVTLTDEYGHARDHLGFGRSELVKLARMGFERAFVGEEEREAMLEAFEREVGLDG